MGLGMLQLLKLRGPIRIVAIDVREDARARAKSQRDAWGQLG